jgi:hypothetical protein
MKVVTVATHVDYYYPSMVSACERLRLNLVVLGMGEKWEGYFWKFTKMKEFLNKEDPNEIIIFIDAFDVIPLLSEKEIIKRFKTFNKPIVISTEESPNNIFMSIGYEDIFTKYDDVYLNSGAYMGYVKYLRKLFDIIKLDTNDDQLAICNTISHPFFKNNVIADKKSLIFLTIRTNEKYYYQGKMELNNKYYRYKNGRLVWKINKPAFVHGPASVNMSHITIGNNLIPPMRTPQGQILYRTPSYISNTQNIKYWIPLIGFLVILLGKNYRL